MFWWQIIQRCQWLQMQSMAGLWLLCSRGGLRVYKASTGRPVEHMSEVIREVCIFKLWISWNICFLCAASLDGITMNDFHVASLLTGWNFKMLQPLVKPHESIESVGPVLFVDEDDKHIRGTSNLWMLRPWYAWWCFFNLLIDMSVFAICTKIVANSLQKIYIV